MGRYPKIRTALKVCNFCKRDETEVKFSGDRITKCNECVSVTRKVWYKKNKIDINRKKIAWRKRVSELPDIVTEIKRGRGRPFTVEIYEPQFDENNLKVIEVYCKEFGCGKELSRTEKLAGNKCLKHQVFIRKIF